MSSERLRDGDIPKIVRDLFPKGFKGYALEIGASDGFYLSNTYELEQQGWEVLCIEPNPYYYEKLKMTRKHHLNVACSSGNENYQDLLVYTRPGEGLENPVSALGGLDPVFVAKFCPDVRAPVPHKVNVRTLDWCIVEVGFPQLDYLSLDVDGLELEILKGFDIQRWKTTVAVVENPFGLKGIIKYFESRGFERVGRTHVNDIWARSR